MQEIIGNGKVKLLILVKTQDFTDWKNKLQGIINRFTHLEILLANREKLDSFKKLFYDNSTDPFIFILDLSEKGVSIKGYGNRYVGISKRTVDGKGEQIQEMEDDYAKWFSENSEFSVIQVGLENKNLEKIIKNILTYFNGE